MDPVRFGRAIRALRRRRGWRQDDLATAARVSRSVVAGIEQGRGDRVTVATLERVARTLDAVVVCRIEWRGENLDRLLDARHAQLVEQIVRRLTGFGWLCATEVSFSVYGERGSIDVLAYHPQNGTVLVVEAKTVIPDLGGMLATLDRKARLARGIARERGWTPKSVSRLLIVAESGTARRRVGEHAATFGTSFALRGPALSRWLRDPHDSASGLWFLPGDTHSVTKQPLRVRQPRGKRGCPANPRHAIA